MKKCLTLFLLATIFTSMFTGCNPSSSSERKKDNEKNIADDSKLVTVYLLSEVSAVETGEEALYYYLYKEYAYDENGNMILEVVYDDEEEYERIERTYDNDGYMTWEKCSWTYSVHYNGVPHYGIERVITHGDSPEKENYGSEAYRGIETKCVYDKDGKKTQEVWYLYDGEVWLLKEFIYDDNGNLLREVEYEDGRKKDRKECTYDEQGKIIKKISSTRFGIAYTAEYKYNNSGDIILSIVDMGEEKGIRKTDYVYNDKGCIIEGGSDYGAYSEPYYKYKYIELQIPKSQAEKLQRDAEEPYMVIIKK